MFLVIKDEAFNFTLMESVLIHENTLDLVFVSGKKKELKFQNHAEATRVFDLIMQQGSSVEYTNLVEFIEEKTTSVKGRKKK